MAHEPLRDDQAGNGALPRVQDLGHANGDIPGVAEHSGTVHGDVHDTIEQSGNADDAGSSAEAAKGDVAQDAAVPPPGDDVVVEDRGGLILVQPKRRKVKARRKLKPSSAGYEALWAGGASMAEEETNLWADLKDGPRQPGIHNDVLPVSDEENANWEREQARVVRRLEKLCADPEEHTKSECRLRRSAKIWSKHGPPDRPELGRYPETVRWVLCRQYWSAHDYDYSGQWLTLLAALPLSHLRWVLERIRLDLEPVEDMAELASVMVGAIELGHYRKARMLYEWSREGQHTKWTEAEAWQSCLYLGRMKAARYFLERWEHKRLLPPIPLAFQQAVSVSTLGLHHVANFGEQAPEWVDFMLEQGADPNSTLNNEADTPILKVSGKLPLQARLRCLHKLLAAGADPNGRMVYGGHHCWGSCPLAMHMGSPQMIRVLLDAKADPQTFCHTQYPFLPVLVWPATPKTASMLLEAGALTLVEPEWREAYMRDRPQPWYRFLEPDQHARLHPDDFFQWPQYCGIPDSFSVMAEAIRSDPDHDSHKQAVYTALLQRMKAFPAPMAAHCCRLAEAHWAARRRQRGETHSMKRTPPSMLTFSCAQAAKCSPEVLRLWLDLGHPLTSACIGFLEYRYPTVLASMAQPHLNRGDGEDEFAEATSQDNGGFDDDSFDSEDGEADASNGEDASMPAQPARKRRKLGQTDTVADGGLEILTAERQQQRRQKSLEPGFLALQRSTGLTSLVAGLCLQAWVEDFEIRA